MTQHEWPGPQAPYDPNARYRFSFGFNHEDITEEFGENGIIKFFLFTDLDAESYLRITKFISWDEGLVEDDQVGDMEAYGVHDFSTTGYEELAGFTSYEVEPDKADEVMEKWRQWFINQGYACGPIESMTWDEYQERYMA